MQPDHFTRQAQQFGFFAVRLLGLFRRYIARQEYETTGIAHVRALDALRLHLVLGQHLVAAAFVDFIGQPGRLLDKLLVVRTLETLFKNGLAQLAVSIGAQVEIAPLVRGCVAWQAPVNALTTGMPISSSSRMTVRPAPSASTATVGAGSS